MESALKITWFWGNEWVQGTLVRCLSRMKYSLFGMFFFFLFLGCTALCDGLSNLYHAAFIQGTLQKEEPISSHCSAVLFTRVPCHVPWGIWRILTGQRTSVSRVPITLLQETAIADENSFYSCRTVKSTCTIFSTDHDCLESKHVRSDREIMLSPIWTRNIACYFFFTYQVDGRRNFPTLRGFWIISPSSRWLYDLTFVGENFIYRKIPKISPGAYIFQRPFLRGLFLEGLIFGGAYLRREICVSTSI